ncbi:MAG: malto-oligosyltrehalose synthase [Terracidiphilus sp.]
MMRHVPLSTYRLQLHAGFTFDDAARVAEYLRDLGISHVYSSPYLQAARGSMHGYNVVDHHQVNRELGGEEGFNRFCTRLGELRLGQVLDIVPNHMATGPENRCLWDVLENGASSRYASWFDIDWNSVEVKLQGKMLIPVLGDQYGRELSAKNIRIEQRCDSFRVCYFDNWFPMAPRSLSGPLLRAAQQAQSAELSFIADSLARLPLPGSTDRDTIESRHRDKAVIYDLLRRLCEEEPEVVKAIGKVVDELNESADALDEVLSLQNYRLAYWRTADQELGYRRFFDVNTLIGLRVEQQEVFDATHERVLEWLRMGRVDGVRVDHPDGLRDPQQYFERLRERAPDAWIVAEKILEPGEELREIWPIAGTTGYDFLNECNELMVYPEGMRDLKGIYEDFIHEQVDFASLAHTMKLNMEREALGSDVNRLTSLFVEICENHRDHRDHTRAEIRRAIREIAASFSVYRTYVIPARDQVTEEDRGEITRAVTMAKESRPDIDAGLFDFIGDVLALRARGGMETEFLLRFQQFTSPAMAKGVEDTAFYCYNRMLALNDVGGSPERDGVSVAEFHEFCTQAQAEHPYSMTTLATHDTKRGDDMRARLAVISEEPRRWRTLVRHWAQHNAEFKAGKLPDRNTEYFLYQTLVGAWPISLERLASYMEKAAREAKQQTSWTQQNKEFEDALRSFIERLLGSEPFIAELEEYVDRVKLPGRINSLAQTLLRFTAPGVPDTYQGGELWDLRLVDPDNRAPVDYDERRALLAELKAGMSAEQIMEKMESGLPKLWVTHCAMKLRQCHPEWFGAAAAYLPLPVDGLRQDHVIAYLRGESVATCVPRWSAKLNGSWSSTAVTLPAGQWRNLLTGDSVAGGSVRMQTLLQRFPVALLTREAE